MLVLLAPSISRTHYLRFCLLLTRLSFKMGRSPSVNMGYFARHVAMQFTLDRRLICMESEDCDYQVGGLRVFIYSFSYTHYYY